MTVPNERCAAAAHKLGELTARKITTALAAINERLARTDGYPAGGESDLRRGHGDTESTATERAAMTRHMLTTMREELRDAITDCCNTIDALDRLGEDALRYAGHAPTPNDDPLCRENQLGRAGVIEWGDPLCCKVPTKAGLCATHYMRWYRWRTDHRISTAKDFAESAA